jgi:hypothetical protein
MNKENIDLFKRFVFWSAMFILILIFNALVPH